MKLEAWLKQDRPLTERLRLVERLAQALNEAHDRGEPLAALEPSRIDVGSDSQCDLSGARKGSPSAEYCAPERANGGPPSPESDVYSAGVIVWETLAGRPCGPAPTHLAEVRPDLPRELADAIMACLERSTEWRPKDLTYVAQLAQHAQGQRGGERVAARSTGPARSSTTTTRAPALKSGTRRESRSQLPLAIAALLLLGAAGGSYYWFTRQGGGATGPTVRATPPRPMASATVAAGPSTTGATTSPVTAPPIVGTSAPATASSPRPVPVAVATPVVAATATPVPTPRPTPPPATASAVPVMPSTPSPTPTPAPPARTETASPASSATTTQTELPSEPPVAATISPLNARRPGKVLFDLRGTGLHAALRARVVPVREAPRGITIAGQKFADPTLVKVLVDFDASVTPGAYAIVLEDAFGRQTKPMTFTVAK